MVLDAAPSSLKNSLRYNPSLTTAIALGVLPLPKPSKMPVQLIILKN